MIVVVVELVNLALAMIEKKCTHTRIQKDGLWGRVFKDFSTFLQAEAHLSTPLLMARAFSCCLVVLSWFNRPVFNVAPCGRLDSLIKVSSALI